MRYRVCTAAVATILTAVGCATDVAREEPTGGLTLALRQTDPSGDVYRLRGAALRVTGPVDQDFEPAVAIAIHQNLHRQCHLRV